MIILDKVEERTKDDKFDGLTLRHPQAAHTRSTSPLPDYDTSEAEHRKVITPSSIFKLKVDAKVWRAALYALGIYIFLTLTVAVPIIVIKSKSVDNNHYKPTYPPPPPNTLWSIDNNNPLDPFEMAFPGTNERTTCNNWKKDPNSPNSVIAFFQLPPTGLITIRSNATYNYIKPDQLNGALSVSMNSYSNESSVLFMIEMQTSSEDIQNQTNVCFNEEGNNRGLSIYIPSNIGSNTLVFNISVVLPQVNSNIESFVSYLPMFSQIYGDLRDHLTFGQFILQGSARPIYCKSLQAFHISVINIGAPIQGSFNVTDSLTLNSLKSPIITDVHI